MPPHIQTSGIGPVVRVVDAVAEGLAEGLALGLHALAGGAELVPGLRVAEALRLEPVLAVGDGPGDDELRHPHPAVPGHAVHPRVVVPAALPAADLLGHVRHVHQRVLVEQRVVVGDDDDVGAGSALHRRGDAGLDVVLVDSLDADLRPRLLTEFPGLRLEEGVGGGDEVRPLEEVQRGALRQSRRAPRGEDARDPGSGDELSTARSAALQPVSSLTAGDTPPHGRGVPATYHGACPQARADE